MLRQKFVLLFRKNIQTRNPKSSPTVRQVKSILDQIKKKVNLSEGKEGKDDGDDEEDEDATSSPAGYTCVADGCWYCQ